MVKPIVCKFKNYFVRFDFINCNKFGEIGVFTDYIEVDKINDIKNKLDNYHKEYLEV